jgi:hypothetical protein
MRAAFTGLAEARERSLREMREQIVAAQAEAYRARAARTGG